MAIFHLHIRAGTRRNGDCAERRLKAVRGLSRARDAVDVAAEAWGNLPKWAKDDPEVFFRAADVWERANAKLWIEIEGALPRELSQNEQCGIIRAFMGEVAGKRLPYVWTMRPDSKEGAQDDANPHFRAMLHERVDDGLERTAAQWFRRANRKRPGRGGAPKDRAVKVYDWVRDVRELYAQVLNKTLSKSGNTARVSAKRRAELTEGMFARRNRKATGEPAPTPAGRHIGTVATHIERGRPGRPGRPSIRGQAERARVGRIKELITEINRIDDEIEALRKTEEEEKNE